MTDWSEPYNEDVYNKRRRRNNLNRSRARRMEDRVAKFLGGNRVPMSGAGSLKGDGLVYTPIGLLVLECKVTSGGGPAGPTLYFPACRWMTKLESDTKALKGKFGILIIHYHGTNQDYVVMRRDWFYHI